MRGIVSGIVATIALSGAGGAWAQCVSVPGTGTGTLTFAKVEQCASMSPQSLASYVMGYVDAVGASTLWGGSPECVERIGSCLEGISAGQLAAMLKQRAEARPDLWHLSCGVIAFIMLEEFCTANGHLE